MSVSSISTNAILSPGYSLGLPQTAGIQAAAPNPNAPSPSSPNSTGQKANGQSPNTTDDNALKVSTQITQVTSQPNANGTLTVQTQFADGTSKTSIQPNPKPVTLVSLLDSGNASQFATLLAAQEQAQQRAA